MEEPIKETASVVPEAPAIKINGRPPVFNTPEELIIKIEEYINLTIQKRGKLRITDLVIHCGFESRQSFYDLEKRDGFSYIIKRARMFIESQYESLLQDGLGAGAIFALKNMGWKDTTGMELSGPGGEPLIPPNIIFEGNKNA